MGKAKLAELATKELLNWIALASLRLAEAYTVLNNPQLHRERIWLLIRKYIADNTDEFYTINERVAGGVTKLSRRL